MEQHLAAAREFAAGLDPDTIHIFADGASKWDKERNGFLGGWGTAMFYREHHRVESGYAFPATNNDMELTAIMRGLAMLKDRDRAAIVYSDSQYAINCVTNWAHGWRKAGWVTKSGTPVANRPIIEAILDLRGDNCRFKWIKGHASHPGNELADKLAVEARKLLAVHLLAESAPPARVRKRKPA